MKRSRAEKKKRQTKKRSTRQNEASINRLPAIVPASVQMKLAKKAGLRCRRAWDTATQLELARQRFYQTDERAYREWYGSTFSDDCLERDRVLSQCREIAAIVSRVRREASYSKIEYWEAYEKVIAPGYEFEGDRIKAENNDGGDQGFSFGAERDNDFDACDCDVCRAARERELKGEAGSFGDDDEASGEAMMSEMFDAMAEEMFIDLFGEEFRSARERQEAFDSFKAALAEESGFNEFRSSLREEQDSEEEKRAMADREVTCQTLYRTLAKYLHPDAAKKYTDRHSELWLLAQEAYRRRDVEELYKVRVLVGMLSGVELDGITISDLLSAGTLLQHKNNQRRKELRVLKKNPAWGFSEAAEETRAQLLRDERKKLAYQMGTLERDLRELEGMLARFRQRGPRRAREAAMPTAERRQFNFDF